MAWKIATLKGIAATEFGLVDGPFGSNLPASSYREAGVPVVRGSNLSLGQCRFNDQEFVFVSRETADRLCRSLCRPGDIIFTKKGTLGQTGIIPVSSKYSLFLLSSNQMKLTVRKELADPLFVYYQVSSPESREKIIRESTASGVPKTNVAYFRDFPVTLPPLDEQRAIAQVLGALDDKIELNRQMNRTLEAMAQAIFKSWFVDFDPVVAKAAGRRPYGMDAETAALFPASFEPSQLGPIPTGWTLGTLGKEFRLTMGQSPPGSSYNESGQGVPFFQGRTDFGFRFPSKRVYCTLPTRFAEPGDTVVSVRAPVGDINMVPGKCALGRGVAAVRHSSGARSYTYYSMAFLKNELDVFDGQGTLFGSIGRTEFETIRVIVPKGEIVERYEQTAVPLDDRLQENELESVLLADLRDTLLPKLLSGEIRVRDAEKAVEDTV